MGEFDRRMEARLVHSRSWLIRVFAWDGLLPLFIASAPLAIEWLLPNKRGAIEIASLALPIGAFLVRFVVGREHIESNHLHYLIRGFQLCVFFVGIVLLVLFEAVVILSGGLPLKGWFILYLIYLALMVIAMYPGRVKVYPVD